MYVLDSYDITLVPVSHYIIGGIQVGGAYCSGRSFSVKGVSITAKSHKYDSMNRIIVAMFSVMICLIQCIILLPMV